MERTIYYSATERAFCFSDVHGPREYEGGDRNPRILDDAVEVSEADYAALMEAQAAPNWATIEPDKEGYPHAIPATDERLAGFVKAERDLRLATSDTLVLPDRWMGYTPEHQAEISAYRQALRDIPKQKGFPRKVEWPMLST